MNKLVIIISLIIVSSLVIPPSNAFYNDSQDFLSVNIAGISDKVNYDPSNLIFEVEPNNYYLQDPGLYYIHYNISGYTYFTYDNLSLPCVGQLFAVIDAGPPILLEDSSPIQVLFVSGVHIVSIAYYVYDVEISYAIDTIHIAVGDEFTFETVSIVTDFDFTRYQLFNKSIAVNWTRSIPHADMNLVYTHTDRLRIIADIYSIGSDSPLNNFTNTADGLVFIFDALGLREGDNIELFTDHSTYIGIFFLTPLGFVSTEIGAPFGDYESLGVNFNSSFDFTLQGDRFILEQISSTTTITENMHSSFIFLWILIIIRRRGNY